MKKSPKRHVHTKRKQHIRKQVPFVSFRAIVIGLSALLLVFGIGSLQSHVFVLGAQTGPVLLAQDGGDTGDGGDTNQQNAPKPPEQQGSQQPSQQSAPSGTNQGSVSQEQQVDCVNPENGQHFTTSFHNCQEINQKSGNAGFKFTPFANPGEGIKSQEIAQPETEASSPAHNQLELQTEGNKGEINMATPGLQVQVKREDDGSIHLTAKQADGTEINLETNALGQLNEALKDKGVAVSTASGSIRNLVLRQQGVEAETDLPISVDPSTHELTVTTPGGVRTVTVLPSQAVNNLLSNKVLTSVETQVSSTSGAVSQVSTLTALNNQPVFAVNGISQKRVLGIIPVGFAKTAFVSATNGSVVQINETILNRILEALSF